MTPELSRELGYVVGATRRRVPFEQRERIYTAAALVNTYDELPYDIRELLDEMKAELPDTADDVIAAAEVHTGAMVALVPTDEDATRLAVDGGEDADQLHVTLGYLGEAALIPEEVQHALVECVARCALDRPTIVGNAFALAAINPDTGVTASTGWELDEVDDLVAGAGGQQPCVALLLSGSQLPGFHDYVMSGVQQTFAAAGMEMHQQHKPWVAHLTLVYTPDADLSYFTDRVGPVIFDRVRLAFGNEVYDIPLGDNGDDGGDE